MAKQAAKVVAAVAAATFLAAARSFADPAPAATVVLHVADYAKVPAGEMGSAQQAAARVYERIGVQLVWTDGSARLAPADGAVHLDVWILTAEMTHRMKAAPDGFGQASHSTKRAYIHYSRILAYAKQSASDPARVLALVLAHEVGHMLLPEYSHAPSGLMRANWEGRIVGIPDFLPAQANTISRMLMAEN